MHTVQYSAVQCNAVQYNAVQCSAPHQGSEKYTSLAAASSCSFLFLRAARFATRFAARIARLLASLEMSAPS
jgi:hypothetical protein